MLERDLAFLARPRGGRGELLEIGDGLDGALAHGRRLVVEVVVEREVVRGDVEDFLQRLVELRLLLVDVGAYLRAQRLLCVGDALLVRVECGPVLVEELLELAALRCFAEADDAFHLGEERVVVEHAEVLEARLRALAVGVLEGEIVGDLQVLAVALEGVAGVDGEELAVGEALVLAAAADGVAVGRDEEERLVLAEAFEGLTVRRDDAPVLYEAGLHVLVAVGELGLEHELGVSVGIFAAHDLEFLRGDARDAREVVRQRLGDGAGGDRVGGMRGLEAVDLPEDRLARGKDALGTLEGSRMRGVLDAHAVALVVVELHDVAVLEVIEDRREAVEVVVLLNAHHGVADLREQLALDFGQQSLVGLAGGEGVDVLLEREVVLQRLRERREGMVDVGMAAFHEPRRLHDGKLRHGGHAGWVGAPGEHDLVAQALALALRGEGRIVLLEHVERVAALVGVDVGHHTARVVRRPVVSVDEARLHAVRLDLFEEDVVRFGPIDAHSRAEKALLDLVLD